MVVLLPARLAELEEVAERAVLDRKRVCRRRLGDELLEAPADAPVVGVEVGDAERLAGAGAEQHVHPLRWAALDARELLGVEAELEDVVRLRVPRELGVGGLVGAVRLPLEEVGDPAPAAVLKAGLVDDVGGRLADGSFGLGRVGWLLDALPFGFEPVEVGLLVLLALAADQLGLRVVAERARDGELERGEMLAREIIVETGGRKGQGGAPSRPQTRPS